MFFRTPYNWVLCRQILWIDFRTWWGSSPLVIKAKPLSPRVRPGNYGFQGKMCRDMILLMLYVILPTLWFHKIFKLIFPTSPCCPKTMYAERCRKLAWETFLWNFPILWYNNSVEHLWTVAYLNILLCFQSKVSFNWLFWLFILI